MHTKHTCTYCAYVGLLLIRRILVLSYTCVLIDIMAKKKAALLVVDEIKKGIDGLNDPNGMDRVLALLSQASASIKAAMVPMDTQTQPFEKKDHFYPTQKNETQLKFRKTTTSPGRKKKHPFKVLYIFAICFQSCKTNTATCSI